MYKFLTLLAAAGWAGAAWADAPDSLLDNHGTVDEPLSFQQLDVNDDGAISPTEAAAEPSTISAFDRADADGDRMLSPEELASLRGEQEDEVAE